MNLFKKATKTQIRLRLALIGPAGSGKTYSSLALATHLGQKIAVIDTEHSSASKYADLFDFDVCQLDSFHPSRYIKAIHAAGQAGYDVLVIDSLSHAWMGKDGELDLVDRAKNTFTAWKDVRPLERALIDAMLDCKCHLIATMRTKTEWVLETNDKGKVEPRKVGTAPIQVSGIDFEFDLAGELNLQNTLTITKSRCPALHGQMFVQPGKELADAIGQWLNSGEPASSGVEADNPGSSSIVEGDRTAEATVVPPPAANPNRELLKRVGQITGHSSKQIAAILEDNFPGRKSDALIDLELRTIVDAMSIDAAVRSGMDAGTVQAIFSKWLGQQDPEIGNEELARLWMGQLDT